MAAGDAKPVPIKDTAYRVTFPILDADGDLVAGATGLDSEFSEDAATFADCASEATQIATSSGMYYLDVASGEMGGDTVAIKIFSTEGKTTPIVLYPQSAANPIHVNVQAISLDSTAADNMEAWFDGTGYASTGNTVTTVTTATNVTTVNGLAANVITAAATAADFSTEVRALASGTADSGTTTTLVDAARTEADTDWWKGQILVMTSGTLLGQARQITAFTPASDTITVYPAFTATVGTQTYEIWPSFGGLMPTTGGNTLDVTATGGAGVDWANVEGQGTAVTLSSTTVNDLTTKTGYALSAAGVDAIYDEAIVEQASVPASTGSFRNAISWIFALSRNKITQTATTQTLRNDADSGNIATSTVSDDGTTATRGEWT